MAEQKLIAFKSAFDSSALRAEARRWIGTPWRMGSRAAGPTGGSDCAGPTHALMVAAGAIPPEPKPPRLPIDYGHHNERSPFEEYIDNALDGYFTRLDAAQTEPRPGDIVGFRLGKTVYHSGVMLDRRRFIHTRPRSGTQVSMLDEPRFRQALLRIWRPNSLVEPSSDNSR